MMEIKEEKWGWFFEKEVKLITFCNKDGSQIKISNFGGAITYLSVPDKNGILSNVVLGFDNLNQYKETHPFLGCTIGRYANRIANGKFVLDNTTYSLPINNGPNSLHGGPNGFHTKVFNIDGAFIQNGCKILDLSYVSPDMEAGYPGNMKVKVRYTFTELNEVKIAYEAETDKPTVINLTNHSYFNLTGGSETILNHEAMIVADSITPTDSTLIPTGLLASVVGTAFDFRVPHTIGDRISEVPGGYDMNYKLRKVWDMLSLAAEVYEPDSGRLLRMYTTEPGLQFYSGNFLDGSFIGQEGKPFDKHSGFCLEAQHFPDSPNKPQFPNVVLRPGEKYKQLTVYKFSIR